ncbi:MAG: septum formation inhibitor Maf [Micrococcales bacterium]|nr:MAG: septum formation inhibitor Maf [Micrococcales bacterium]PIE28024.1 MAG: septum formation inhibitor Maf [Micrococcales bacterium]
MSGAPNPPVTLILASASPARLGVLKGAGVDPLVRVSEVDEPAVIAQYGVPEPPDIALLLARAKAEDVAASADLPPGLVLGCDSVLEFDGQVRGKPTDRQQARDWARSMSGRSGTLHTGHWLIDTRPGGHGAAVGAVAETLVRFTELTDEEVEAYLDTGEPLHVAGGFTIDGLGGAFVAGLAGCHSNVIGVSLPLVRALAARVGVSWPRLWAGLTGPA